VSGDDVTYDTPAAAENMCVSMYICMYVCMYVSSDRCSVFPFFGFTIKQFFLKKKSGKVKGTCSSRSSHVGTGETAKNAS